MVTASELTRLLEALANVRVSVVGDFCLDAYWHLDESTTERSIETGLEILRVKEQRYTLGGAGNVLANLVDLGVQSVRAIGMLAAIHSAVHCSTSCMPTAPTRRDAGTRPEWQTAVYAKPYLGQAPSSGGWTSAHAQACPSPRWRG